MSLILDALKKAEAERQRQSGPTLLELRVTAPRRRWPTWSVLIGILLVANIVVVLGTALRPRPAAESSGAPATAVPPGAAATATAPASTVGAVPTVLTAAAATPAVPPAAVPTAPPLARGSAGDAMPVDAAPFARTPEVNPADEEPALAPPAASRSEAELPALSELGGSVPALRLDLHVYAERPADRYALINMHKAHEGDTLPEGARVIAIDRDGVELSYRGTQFMLRPQ
jgi:general secretion pathway protein B